MSKDKEIPPLVVVGASGEDFLDHAGYPASKLRCWIQWVTPALAALWLKGSTMVNRNRRKRRITMIGRDVSQKHYAITGVPIIFDSDGQLIDGQHRLSACVIADAGFFTLVVQGVDRHKAVEYIDGGAGKTFGDRLKMRLDPGNANACAAVALLLWQFGRPNVSSSWPVPSYHEVESAFKKYRSDIEWAVSAIGSKIDPGLSSGGAPVMVAFAYARQTNPVVVEAAALAYKTGNVASENDPMRKLRAFMASANDRAQVGNKNSSSMFTRHAVALVALGYIERAVIGKNPNKKVTPDIGVLERLAVLRVARKKNAA